MLDEKALYEGAWLETKRQISGLRGRIRSLIAEFDTDAEEGAFWQAEYERVAVPILTRMHLEKLRALLAEHKMLYEGIRGELDSRSTQEEIFRMSSKASAMGDFNVPHIQDTNQNKTNELESSRPAAKGLQGGRTQSPDPEKPHPEEGASSSILEAAGLGEITLKQVVNAGSERFRGHLANSHLPVTISEIVEAAYRLRRELHISQQSWKEACASFSQLGATLCILITDHAAHRPDDPVRKPAAYFKSLIKKAMARELNVHASIMAILKREEGENATTASSSDKREKLDPSVATSERPAPASPPLPENARSRTRMTPERVG